MTTDALVFRMTGLRHRLLCGFLHMHKGPIESYGDTSYVNCVRCGELRQPMPRYWAEHRFGDSV